MIDFSQVTGFDWDEGNNEKNWHKHKVSTFEAEQIFFNEPLLVVDDEKHSIKEKRYAALGKTNEDRRMLVIFTIRDMSIRVISARDMKKKERMIYEQKRS